MTRFRMSAVCALGALAAVIACGSPQPVPAAPSSETQMKGTQSPTAMPTSSDSAPATIDNRSASVVFSAAQIQHGQVHWDAVTSGTASASAMVPGELVPNEDHTVRLGAPARGRVLTVRVRPGDRVTVGQILVTMQSTDAGMAQSDMAKANAEVTARRAEADYAASARARAERLLVLKAIPRQDYERAVSDDERAKASVAQAHVEASRARSTAAQLGAQRGVSGVILLRAKSVGVVLARTAVPGTVVEAGTPLVAITDPSTLWLSINAPEQFAALFARDGHLRFVVPAFPADTLSARIEAIGAGLEPSTRTLSVRGTITNTGLRLKPNMLATVLVDGASKRPAIFVPENAVQIMQGKSYAFLSHPDAKGGARFERREVVVGPRANGQVAVLRGLAAGDIVVVAGAFVVKAEFQKAAMPKMVM